MQHDAQLAELARLFANSEEIKHLPFSHSAIVVINRDDVSSGCKRLALNQGNLNLSASTLSIISKSCAFCVRRCLHGMPSILSRLRKEFNGTFDVIEILGNEPYYKQVKVVYSLRPRLFGCPWGFMSGCEWLA